MTELPLERFIASGKLERSMGSNDQLGRDIVAGEDWLAKEMKTS